MARNAHLENNAALDAQPLGTPLAVRDETLVQAFIAWMRSLRGA